MQLNIIPADKYKISEREYNILKAEIEGEVLQKLAKIQNNYDNTEFLRNIAKAYQPYNYIIYPKDKKENQLNLNRNEKKISSKEV